MTAEASATTPDDAPAPALRGLVLAAGATAAALLALEVSLLRLLLVASWHHFAFCVISAALLGFGASGAALTLFRERVLPRAEGVLLGLSAATALAIPLALRFAWLVPIEARLAPGRLGEQLATWGLFWALLTAPFLVGATALGLALMAARSRVGAVYGADLAGSGLGGTLATVAMLAVPPAWLPTLAGALALPGGLLLAGVPRRRRAGVVLAAAGAAALLAVLWPPGLRVDPFKYAAHVERLVAQGDARRVATTHGPRATTAVYAGPAFHEVPFLTGGTAPPPLLAIVRDGHWAGSVLRVDAPAAAEVVDHTLMAFPYALAPAAPRVALLEETGGIGAWLALRRGAARVWWVQPDGALFDLLAGPLREEGGAVVARPEVEPVAREPRAFVDHAPAGSLDLLQVVALEGTAAGGGGLGGLGEDHLVTVEGVGAALEALAPRGLLTACRGIQDPPRDHVKLLATVGAALRRRGAADPGAHVVVVRDYLAACVIVRPTPWGPADVRRVRAACAERWLTPVWFPGIRADELNRPDELPGPAGEPGDWLHHAARGLLGDAARAERFVAAWQFDVRPPTDDRPFFHDFARLDAIDELRAAYGDLWLTRTELAFPFVLGALGATAGAGLLLTLAPLALRRAARRAPGRGTALVFGGLGLGYLLLELTYLSRAIRLVGDPVLAASVTIATFLVGSGAGALVAHRLDRDGPWVRRLPWAPAALGLLTLLGLGGLLEVGSALPLPGRLVLAVFAAAPLAFALGFPFPLALARLDRGAPTLVPWAWGINGFASVVAGPLTVALAMTWGYDVTGALAVGLYLGVAALLPRLPTGTVRDGS